MAHNGGRSQLNVSGVTSREFLFLDHGKTGDGWRLAFGLDPSILSADGYPQSTPGGDPFDQITIPNTVTEYTGAWIVDWLGEGQINFSTGAPGVTILEGSEFVTMAEISLRLRASGVNGRVKFTFNDEWTVFSRIIEDSDSGNPINRMRLYRADHEQRVLSGETFNPEALAVIRAMNPGVLRFLGLIGNSSDGANGVNTVKWGHRPLTTAVSYGLRQWIPSLWVGTIDDTDTYTNASVPADPDHRHVVQGTVTNANTVTTPTLAGKAIKNQRGNALGVGDIAAGAQSTFVFDEDLDCYLYYANGLDGGVPVEVLCDLCNAVGAHAWFTIPHLVDDDYITNFATTVKNRLDPSLRAYFEHSNEIWNFAAAFHQTGWAYNKGLAAGITDADNRPHHYWYAKRFTEMADLVAAAFGAQTNYRRVIGVQAAGNGPQYNTYRFLGTDLSVVAPNRPIDKCEAISFATYFQGANVREFVASYANPLTALLAAADDYNSGVGASMQSALSYIDSDIRNGQKSGVDGEATLETFENTIYDRWHAYAVTHGKKLIEYEAALALDEPTEAALTALGHATAYSAKIATLIAAYKNDARAKQITLDRYNHFVAKSNAEFPSQFLIAGDHPWAVIPGGIYDTPFKMYDAIVEFNGSTGLLQQDGAVIALGLMQRQTSPTRISKW